MRAVRERLGLRRPYLLTVGTLEPRKNVAFLVDVFERLDAFDGDFVIAGMRGWKCEATLDRLKTSSRADRIRYLDYVPGADLPALYAGAELFVIASHYTRVSAFHRSRPWLVPFRWSRPTAVRWVKSWAMPPWSWMRLTAMTGLPGSAVF